MKKSRELAEKINKILDECRKFVFVETAKGKKPEKISAECSELLELKINKTTRDNRKNMLFMFMARELKLRLKSS